MLSVVMLPSYIVAKLLTWTHCVITAFAMHVCVAYCHDAELIYLTVATLNDAQS